MTYKVTMQSMTGFGRGAVTKQGLVLTCEVRSVNQRYLDVRIRLPNELLGIEHELEEIIKQQVARGRIELSVFMRDENPLHTEISFNAGAARALIDQMNKFASLTSDDVRLGDLFHLAALFSPAPSSDWKEKALFPLKDALALALSDMNAGRAKEGRLLYRYLMESINSGANHIKVLKEVTKNAAKNHHALLKNKVLDLIEDLDFDSSRLAQEIAILVIKSDITEELNRLESHFNHFGELCLAREPIGRKLDFMCQEMFREANTIGSKVVDAELSYLIVDLKSEIERLREQVQNIE